MEKNYTRFLGQCKAIAQRLQLRGPPYIHHLRTSPFMRSPCLLRLAFSIFLHLAFFISHQPPLPDPHAPTLPPRDTSAATISHGKGSGNLPKTSGSRTIRPTAERRIWSCISFGVVFIPFLYTGSCFRKISREYYVNLFVFVVVFYSNGYGR